MEITLKVALIGALFTFFAALLTALVNFYKERFEKEKWRRTMELEEQRFNHEKNRWALELTNLREMELFKQRFHEYPELFALLATLSSHNLQGFKPEKALTLADKLNGLGYGKVGLCMLPDTREAIFILRDYLKAFAATRLTDAEMMISPRTDLIELMRRDLSHDRSRWRDYKSLIEINREQLQRITDKQVPISQPLAGTPNKRR